MKKRKMRIGFLWLSSFLLIVFFAHATEAIPLLISATKTVTLGGLTFDDDDLVVYDTDTKISELFFDGSAFFGHNEDIDGVAFLDDGSIVLSTKSSAQIGDIHFNNEDIVQIVNLTTPTTGTARLYFDGSDYFDKNEDIDAVTVLSNGNILLSTKNKATIGGVTFHKNDLVEFNPFTGNASMFFDGSDFFGDGDGWHHGGQNNIDAVSVIDSDTIVISTSKTARIGDFIFNDEDLILIDWSDSADVLVELYFVGSEHFDDAHRADIDAFAIVGYAGGTPIPEPTTIALLGIGLIGLAGAAARRRRKKKAKS